MRNHVEHGRVRGFAALALRVGHLQPGNGTD
jgi:hypothetical protein